ncbi:oxidoreductase, aldo/keto reductase family protein [Bacillus inaquosorum KCTC 13429]|uniref:Oxidoreductase, aldo/keto reductase family protein n=1 Tax=Bacillus inaquosorum KCTC 13429 TaxID=1236548 RepID=A0A9W5PDQ6_9BACI|nr:oxidoreductase, aldo/keto reductase family protein [Bacillus inaquosorum KCTC 13429]
MTSYNTLASGRLTRDWSETTHHFEKEQIQKDTYNATIS